LSFDDGVISLDESQIFRVRIPVTAPDFSGPYAFDLRLASSLAPGIDAFADIGDVVPGLGLNDDQVNVRPFVDEDAFRSGSVQPPLEFVESELYPNFAPSASSETFTIAANLTYDADLNEGYNQFQVLLPPGYGAPGSVSLTVGALGAGALQPSAYSSDASEGELLITLTQSDHLFLCNDPKSSEVWNL
jgi:hypothetical protein